MSKPLFFVVIALAGIGLCPALALAQGFGAAIDEPVPTTKIEIQFTGFQDDTDSGPGSSSLDRLSQETKLLRTDGLVRLGNYLLQGGLADSSTRTSFAGVTDEQADTERNLRLGFLHFETIRPYLEVTTVSDRQTLHALFFDGSLESQTRRRSLATGFTGLFPKETRLRAFYGIAAIREEIEVFDSTAGPEEVTDSYSLGEGFVEGGLIWGAKKKGAGLRMMVGTSLKRSPAQTGTRFDLRGAYQRRVNTEIGYGLKEGNEVVLGYGVSSDELRFDGLSEKKEEGTTLSLTLVLTPNWTLTYSRLRQRELFVSELSEPDEISSSRTRTTTFTFQWTL